MYVVEFNCNGTDQMRLQYVQKDKKDHELIQNYTTPPPLPHEVDFQSLIVNKPWGYEYLMYKNENVEVWSLFIRSGASTSTHCHPNKKTGLIVVEGDAEFTTLHETLSLQTFDAVMIEQGVFHATRAKGPQGIHVIEVENPPAKHDLLRLRDQYGRAGAHYEGIEKMSPQEGEAVRLAQPPIRQTITRPYINCSISVHHLGDSWEPREPENMTNQKITVVLDGMITLTMKEKIFQPGDIIPHEILSDIPSHAQVMQATIMTIGQNCK